MKRFSWAKYAAAGAVLLLTHSHAAFQSKQSFLVQVTHTTMGAHWPPFWSPAAGSSCASPRRPPGWPERLRPWPCS